MQRLQSFDSIRGLAALTVICAHYTPTANLTGVEGIYLFPFLHTFSLADMAVVVFYGLSAFLLAWIAEQNFDAWEFARARYYRIVPLYCFVFLFSLIVIRLMDHDTAEFNKTVRNIWLYALFVYNWTWALGKVGYLNEFGHFWSLSVEIQFYFGFALLFPLLRRLSFWTIFIGSLVLGNAVRLLFATEVPVGKLYFNSFSYIETFLICGALGVMYARGITFRIHWLYVLALFVVGYLWTPVIWTNSWQAVAMFSVVSIVVSAMLWKAAHENWLPWLNWMGPISYGLYLWHLPVKFVLIPFAKAHVHGNVEVILMFLFYLVACFVLSSLTYRFIERPFLRRRKLLLV